MFNMLYSLTVLILFLAVCLFGAAYKRIDSAKDYHRRLNSFRGIFALEIVIGHVVRYERTVLYPLGKIMIISVAFFLFVSAFGMVRSYRENKNYLKGFLTCKVLYLLILTVITYGVNLLFDWFSGWKLSYYVPGKNILTTAVSMTNWYLKELILFYLLFYLVYKYIRRFRVLIITVISAVFGTLVFLDGWIQGWYASILAFPAGLAFGEYFDNINGFMKTIWGKLITGALALAGGCSLFFDENSLLGMVYLRNAMCIAGLLMLIYFCSFFETGNKASRLLGRYSTEIYLFQFVYLNMSSRFGWDFELRLIFVLAATLLTAVAVHPLTGFIRRKLRSFQREP